MPIDRLFMVAALAGALGTLQQQAAPDPVKAKVAAFEPCFRGSGGKPPTVDERKAALATLTMPQIIDDPRVAQEIVTQNGGLFALADAIGVDLAAMKSSAALEWLIANVVGDDTFARRHKVAIAHQVGAGDGPPGEALLAALDKAFARAKSSDDRIALLEGVQSAGPAARRCVPEATKLLADADREVRERAADALAHLAAPEAIAPLVRRLDSETGATRRRIGFALEALTQQRFGADFFGVPLEGRAFVFVVDCSQWMLVDASEPRWTRKLADLLGALRADDRFSIVAFADEPRWWKRSLVAALQLVDETADPLHRAPDGIYLVTAGKPQRSSGTQASREEPELVRLIHADVTAGNPGRAIVLNAVAFGAECDEKLLEELTAENGGRFVRR